MNIQLICRLKIPMLRLVKMELCLWHYSEDLKILKKLTSGHTIIMGRKTWDSLPIKPLPNRKNIVISSTKQTGVDSYKSIDACMEYFQRNQSLQNIFVIGGMSIYKHFMIMQIRST